MVFFSETVEEVRNQPVYGAEAILEFEDVSPDGDVTSYVSQYLYDGKEAFDIYYVSSAPSPMGVFVGIHGHLDGAKIKYLWMRIGRIPDSEIPEDITKISDDLRGYPTGFSEFCALIGDRKAPCAVEVDLALTPKGKWKSKISPRPDPEIAGFKKNYERLGLINEEETEVAIYCSSKGAISFEVETKLEISLNEKCFETACSMVVDKLAPFVEEVP